MTKQAESKLLDFLTSKENLPFVVDILTLGNQVRNRILTDFWRELACCLRKGSSAVSPPPVSMKMELSPDDKDPVETQLRYFGEHLKPEKQYLSYDFFVDRWKGFFGLGFGLTWQDMIENIPNRPELFTLKPVAELREQLASMGFKESKEKEGSYLGWKYLSPHDSIDGFLAVLGQDREGLLRDITDTFWAFVQETVRLVAEANEAIVRAGQND
jgi:hypothetical protein